MRIKRLEQSAGISRSTYCACYGAERLKYEVKPITIEEWKRRTDAGIETDERLPDVCEICAKPIDKRFIEQTFEECQAIVAARLRQVEETWLMHHDL